VSKSIRYVGLIPAAGAGTRVGPDIPKQFLRLGQRTILELAIAAMLADARINRVFVVVAANEDRWQSLDVDAERVEFLVVGGATRAQSVRNGLAAISARMHDDDRVLVHDAARPCLGAAELARLIDQVGADDRGGLLAIPLTDTLKRSDDGRAVATVQRAGLWCAQTPQMFGFAALRAALAVEPLDGITDEASAIERQGSAPLLVLGSATNIKITTMRDLEHARAILRERELCDNALR